MQLISFPDKANAEVLLARPNDTDLPARRERVAALLTQIQQEGDLAVRQIAAQFDPCVPDIFEVSKAEFAAAEASISPELRAAIEQAYHNIRRFHAPQIEQLPAIETMPGVQCMRKTVAIDRVGLYVPGGTAPLFSTALMLGVPAQLAGCETVILCTPPRADGTVHPAILVAAARCGIQTIFKIGGVQAIGAMAYGTATIPKVYKIFGPGNGWVTAAKQLVSLDGVAIDMPAGPSEVAIIADYTAHPDFVAADLLAQAEHGVDSQVLLITTDPVLPNAVQKALANQLALLPRRDFAEKALSNSKILLVQEDTEAMWWSNAYAPEHLIIQTKNAEQLATQVTNAGSVFIGDYTPESAGDYASGTNHILPTGGYARAYAGVSVDSFVKKITFQQITPAGITALGPTIMEMARAEGLEAHAAAVQVRLDTLHKATATDAPQPFRVELLVRQHLLELAPYSSARDEAKTTASTVDAVFLDANENSLGGPLAGRSFNRYPHPRPQRILSQLAEIKGVTTDQIFLGNGSDEAIDLLFRVFCAPGRDHAILLPPTYGMYAVQAGIHETPLRKIPLNTDFQPDAAAVLGAMDHHSKLLFLCSPNNPTGQLLPAIFILEMLRRFPGIVVIDEAYIDFATEPSWVSRLAEFPNLVVLQTLSKAWGLAGLRMGMAFASPFIINMLNKIKYPYNIGLATIEQVEEALGNQKTMQAQVALLVAERKRLATALAQVPLVEKVFPSDANFLLVRVQDAQKTYDSLRQQGIVVRNRTKEPNCLNCLRITIGTPEENDRLIASLNAMPNKK